jgi:hypothetical protein
MEIRFRLGCGQEAKTKILVHSRSEANEQKGGNSMTTNSGTACAKCPWGKMRLVWQMASGTFLGLVMAATAAGSLTPQYSNSAGAVSAVSIAQLAPLEVVTAVRNGSGDLEVIVWQDTGTAIVQASNATAGAIKKVAIAPVSANQVVTAVANSTGNLELILWKVDSSGKITKQYGTTYTLTVTRVSIIGLAVGSFATATRNSSGDLDVEVWTAGASSFSLTAGSSGGAVSEVAIAALQYASVIGSQFVTAVRNSGGDLEVINWIVGSGTLTQGGHATLGAIKHLSVVAIGTLATHTVYATAVINGSGDLEDIEWSVLGNSVKELGSGTAGAASGVAICQGFPWAITAVRNGSGDLSVQQWDDKTKPFSEAAKYNTTSPVTAIAVAPDAFIGSMVTAVRNSSGDLEVTAWQEK